MMRPLVFGLVAALGLAAPLSASAIPNVDPVANDDAFTVKAGQYIDIFWEDIKANDIDYSGGHVALSATQNMELLHGTVTPGSTVFSFRYQPDAGYTGTDTMTYQVMDDEGNTSAPGKITFTMSNVVANRAPASRNDIYATQAGKFLQRDTVGGLLRNDGDLDNNPISIHVPTFDPPLHGKVVLNPDLKGAFSYQPDPGFTGTDQFRYRVTDGTLLSPSWATVDVYVTPIVTGVSITKVVGGIAGGIGSVTAQVAAPVKSGNVLYLNVAGSQKPYKYTDATGMATWSFSLPTQPGSYKLTVNTDSTYFATGTLVVLPVPKPVVTAVALGVPAGKPGQIVSTIAKITSANAYKAGAPVSAYLDGKKVATKLTDATGTAKIAVKLPALAGKHSIKVVSGSKSATKNFTYGTGVTAKLAKLKTVKTKKTQTIKGSFGTKSGKITLRITDPKGKTVTKTVTLNSKGKFSYKYKVSSVKGTWTVRYYYNATPKYYGAKNYKLTFKVK